ncbi:MAG: PD-(D/E)XK nuclease family protein [Actinomycetota bacterium]|nr:PD-(D/E)XK nuclease family protein [Actinomycetota bacterium]
MRLSYTAISSYERCPLSYRYRYLDGIEEEPSPHLSFGRSLHAALEWLYQRDVPVPPSLEELLDYLVTCWSNEGFEDEEQERSFLAHAQEVLSCFYHLNVGDFRLPVALEARFELDMGDYVLSGVIDRVDRHPDGRYEIIDYKTNRRLPELSRLREDLQLPIYQIACGEIWGITPAKLTFYYLVPNQRFSTRPLDGEGLARVRERIDLVASRIARGEFDPSPNRLCPWCSYRDICPAFPREVDEEEAYRSRYRALLQRRERLEALIGELEEEMASRGVSPAMEGEGEDDGGQPS